MIKLPRTLRFFRKPDHISFLIGFPLLLAATLTNLFELKIGSLIFFTFTLSYEVFEISKGGREIIKVDHITFVIAFILLIVTFWYSLQILLIFSSILFGFTLGYEIYSVRKKDLEKKKRKME